MYKGLRSLVFKVADIEKAKDWYSRVFEVKPILDTSFAVVFRIGDAIFSLSPSDRTTERNDDNVIVYWEVDDIDSEFERLLKLGATVDTEIHPIFNSKLATIIDPFGNIMGIRTTAENTGAKSVEQQPSQTAMGVAVSRALAAIDERDEIRGHDYLAEIFLTEYMKVSSENRGMIKEAITSRTPGMYEFIMARTVFFDAIVEQALRDNIAQIVFLGAGYDTRAYRFSELIEDTRIFELDIQTTQSRKISILEQNNIAIPDQLTFVPINFNTETLEDVLSKSGFEKGRKNLFIWEGVTYYLSPEAVDETLNFIQTSSSEGSTVCFDYSAGWPEMFEAYGVKQLIETMSSEYPGERSSGFGVERGKIDSFLAERGFQTIDHFTAEEMEDKYLTLGDGTLAGRVTGIFCLAHASVQTKPAS